jgi:REP element-mobilizing transposase RayT
MFYKMKMMQKLGWHNRGCIPHFDANCLLQHVVLSGKEGVDLTTFGLADLIEVSLLHYDKQRYCLHAWCIMPDHVHIYIVFSPSQLLGRNVLEWKSWITRNWQKKTNSKAIIFSPDYFDRYSRTLDQASRAIGYIEHNPAVAGYVVSPEQWRWS